MATKNSNAKNKTNSGAQKNNAGEPQTSNTEAPTTTTSNAGTTVNNNGKKKNTAVVTNNVAAPKQPNNNKAQGNNNKGQGNNNNPITRNNKPGKGNNLNGPNILTGNKKNNNGKVMGFLNDVKDAIENRVTNSINGINSLSSGVEGMKNLEGASKWGMIFLIAIAIVAVIMVGKALVVKYYSHVESSPFLIEGTKNANHSVIISQDPDSMNYIPIKRSENEEGIELSYTFWCFYMDKQDNDNNWKHIFHKGNSTSYPNRAPGVWIHPKDNTFRVYMNTFDKILDYADNIPFPVKKWWHCAIVVQNKISHLEDNEELIYDKGKNHILDVYINGKLKKSHQLSGVPKQNNGDLWVNINGGYNGYLSKLKYYNRALGFTELETMVKDGPAKVITSDTGEIPPYLDDNWWFNNDIEGN